MPFSDLIFPLDKHLSLPKGLVNRFHCDWLDDPVITVSNAERGLVLRPFDRFELINAAVHSSGFLTEIAADKPVFYLHLCIQENVDILPGDTLGVFVKNDQDRVEKFLERLGIKGEKPCVLNGRVPSHLPCNQPVTPFFIITHWVDLDTPIKKVGLAALSAWAKDSEARRLQELASREAPPISTPITLEYLLTSLPSLTPDFSTVLNLLTPFKPRVYSVANDPVIEKASKSKIIKIVLSKVEGGLASTYLFNLTKEQSDLIGQFASLTTEDTKKDAQELFVYLRKRNDFTVTQDVLTQSVIMVATGTGIGPFIGMLEHRENQIKNKWSDLLVIGSEELAPWFLIYGCRDEAHRIFKYEVKHFVDVGILKEQFICFSRDPDQPPRYVQDCLKEEKELLIPLLMDHDKTVMMVCGEASKMIPSVKDALGEGLQIVKNIPKEEAVLQVSKLVESKKLIFDSWVL